MRRALVRFTIAASSPPLVRRLPEGTVPASFGRWLRERVASSVPDWPAVGFHRIEITAAGLELMLVAGGHARAEAQFAAVMRAVWRDTTRGAVRCGWTRRELWVAAEIVQESVGVQRAAPPRVMSRPNPHQQHHRQHEEHSVHRPRCHVVRHDVLATDRLHDLDAGEVDECGAQGDRKAQGGAGPR